MRSLLDNLAEAAQKRTAIGHFNISDLVGLNAVVAAARRVGVPMLIGTSEGEGLLSAHDKPLPSSEASAMNTISA